MSAPVASTDEVSTEAPSMDNVQVGEVQQALSFSSLPRCVGFLEGLSITSIRPATAWASTTCRPGPAPVCPGENDACSQHACDPATGQCVQPRGLRA